MLPSLKIEKIFGIINTQKEKNKKIKKTKGENYNGRDKDH